MVHFHCIHLTVKCHFLAFLVTELDDVIVGQKPNGQLAPLTYLLFIYLSPAV